jgi:hypothetical protein
MDYERPTEGELLWGRINLEIGRENAERCRRGMSPLEPAERDTLRACVLNGRPYPSVSSLPVPAPAPEVAPVPEPAVAAPKPKVPPAPGRVIRIPGRMFR